MFNLNQKNCRNMFKYFANVASKIDANIPKCNTNPLSYLNNINPNSFYAFNSTWKEVSNLILIMPNKTCDISSIPACLPLQASYRSYFNHY